MGARSRVSLVLLAALCEACGLLIGSGGDDPSVRADAGGADSGTADGAAGVDGEVQPDGTVPPTGACGGPDTLRDTFDDASLLPRWNASRDGDIAIVANGRLEISAPATGAGWAGYYSNWFVDMRGANVTVAVPSVLTGEQAHTRLTLFRDGTTMIGMWASAGNLNMTIEGPDGNAASQITYSATNHAYWRIAESAGILFFQTSSDRRLWATQFMQPAPDWLEFAMVALEAGADSAAPDGGIAAFDDLNVEAPSPAPSCPVARLSDDFESSATWLGWRPLGDHACSAAPDGGALRLRVDGAVTTKCQLDTKHAYDLTHGAVTIELDVPALAPDVAPFFLVREPGEGYASMEYDGGELWGFVPQVAGELSSGRAYAGERFWRVRADAGTITFEASPDGASGWTPVVTGATTLDLTHVLVVVGIDQRVPDTGAQEVLVQGIQGS